MKFKYFILFAVFIFTTLFSCYANTDSVRIEVNAPQLENQMITFCAYFDGKTYVVDSLYLSNKGEGLIHRKEKYPEGLFLFHLGNDKYIDVLMADDQSFSIAIDTTDLLNNTKIEGAPQTEVFHRYAAFLQQKGKEREALINEYHSLPDELKDQEKTQNQLNELNNEVVKFQSDIKSQYAGQWVSTFLKGAEPVQTGPYPYPKSQEEANEQFYYLKDHFFDNVDLQDKRFWYTNYFPFQIINYMEKQVEQVPDSLANAASRLIAKTVGDSTSFNLMMNKLLDFSLNSQLMGWDNIWLKLAEDYYFTGMVTWGDSTHHANIRSEYNKLQYNRIGMKAHNMKLQDSNGKPTNLYNVGKKYTLIYFYEPSCGHCQQTTPEIYDKVYKKYAGDELDIACIYIMTDKKEWMDFVMQHQIEGEHWHNLWDPDRKSFFWKYYDTSSTPSVYLIDENKTIIAKKLDPDTLDQIFKELLQKN